MIRDKIWGRYLKKKTFKKRNTKKTRKLTIVMYRNNSNNNNNNNNNRFWFGLRQNRSQKEPSLIEQRLNENN